MTIHPRQAAADLEEYEERAGILWDGGAMPRNLAERLAALMVRQKIEARVKKQSEEAAR